MAKIHENIQSIEVHHRELLVNKEPASKSNPMAVMQARKIIKNNLPKIVKSEVEVLKDPLSDDFMNLVEVAASLPDQTLFGITFLNPHCFLPSKEGEEPLLRRSVEVKIEILTEVLGWQLLVIDQNEFLASEDKEKFILDKIEIGPMDQQQPPKDKSEASKGRRVKRK